MKTLATIKLTNHRSHRIFHHNEFIYALIMSPNELGQALRNRRKLAKITQTDLADLSGLSVHTLSDLESGKGNPTLEVLSKLCHVLGLEIQLVPRKPGVPPSKTSPNDEAKS